MMQVRAGDCPQSVLAYEPGRPRCTDAPDRRGDNRGRILRRRRIWYETPSRSEFRLGQRYGLEIRTATSTDASGVAAMLEAAGRPVPGADLGARLDAVRQGAGTALLALEWGPPSGIVVLHWYPALLEAAPVAQVTMLLVAPDDRRRGIGRQLLKSASQAARMAGCDCLQLLGRPNAPTLDAFCRATGFVEGPGGFVRPLRKKS